MPERRRAAALRRRYEQREIGPACDHKQAWASKLLEEKRRSTAIATAAALELKRLPAFSSLMATVEGTEKLVDALGNHLIKPEREGLMHPFVAGFCNTSTTMTSPPHTAAMEASPCQRGLFN